jgi:hypothetical protein
MAPKNRVLVTRLGKKGGAATALLRNQLTFWSVTRQEGILNTIQAGSPACLFFMMYYDWM